jgi:hypothetical protein
MGHAMAVAARVSAAILIALLTAATAFAAVMEFPRRGLRAVRGLRSA